MILDPLKAAMTSPEVVRFGDGYYCHVIYALALTSLITRSRHSWPASSEDGVQGKLLLQLLIRYANYKFSDAKQHARIWTPMHYCIVASSLKLSLKRPRIPLLFCGMNME